MSFKSVLRLPANRFSLLFIYNKYKSSVVTYDFYVIYCYRVMGWRNRKIYLVSSFRTSVALFSPFNFWHRGSRGKWITNPTCGSVSSFWWESALLVSLKGSFTLRTRKHFSPRIPTTKVSVSRNWLLGFTVHFIPTSILCGQHRLASLYSQWRLANSASIG